MDSSEIFAMTSKMFIAEVFRLFVGFVLLFAAIAKIKTFEAFRKNLFESLGWSVRLSSILAPAVVATELIWAGLILPGLGISYLGMIGALALFVLFTGFISYKYMKEDIVKCGCFGEAERSVSVYDLLRNVLILMCIVYYLVYCGESAVLNAQFLALACGLALILTVIAIEFHEIAMLIAYPSDRGI